MKTHRLMFLASATALFAACSQQQKPVQPVASAPDTTETTVTRADSPAPSLPLATDDRANVGDQAAADAQRSDNAADLAAVRTPELAGAPRAADNTARNERDRDGRALTPGDQSNEESDRKITQAVRQAVMGNSSLSFTAKNVKIITVGGKVTLRGPVNTQDERVAIEAAARKLAGVTQVDNQLEVK